MGQTIAGRKKLLKDNNILEEKKEFLEKNIIKRKNAFFNKAVWKSWANVLGVLALSGILFLASLFI